MKKSDIKNGMHVITNENVEYVIISEVEAQGQIKDLNTADRIMVQVNGIGWMPFDDYDDDLRYHDHEEEDDDDELYDIKKVYAPQFYAYVLSSVDKNDNKFIEVWERECSTPKKIKKMTKADIEKELGYEIEIVD